MNLPTIHTKLEKNGLRRRSNKFSNQKESTSIMSHITRRNVELRWEEHENTSKDSKPATELKENLSHKFSWKILFAAPENKRIRKIYEASEIALKRPSLNEQSECKKLLLFCNGVT